MCVGGLAHASAPGRKRDHFAPNELSGRFPNLTQATQFHASTRLVIAIEAAATARGRESQRLGNAEICTADRPLGLDQPQRLDEEDRHAGRDDERHGERD
jgi:hypothetical protein